MTHASELEYVGCWPRVGIGDGTWNNINIGKRRAASIFFCELAERDRAVGV